MQTMNPHSSNPFDKQQPIKGVKKIICVASGKGGVGKSTIALNLAVALSKKNKVGLLDADIYGPSLPRLTGTIKQKPMVTPDQRIEPIARYNLKMMSIGYLVEEGAAVVWRGPMLFKAMDQFFRDVNWGELDYLVIDLPPGTGDIQLSLAQKVPVAGALIVTTPQNLAFIDAQKAIDMFSRVNVPILGVVENMSYMVNPANSEKIQMFPKGELNSYLDAKGILKIAEVPFNPALAMSSEAGVPILESHPDSLESKAFISMAAAIQSLT